MPIARSLIETPVGPLVLEESDGRLCVLEFIKPEEPGRRPAPARRADGAIAELIAAYFAGDLHALDRIEVAPTGTAFQLRVWAALRRIPAGETCSYQELAAAIDAPSAARAVGAANGRNPIAVVVPCHRVIATGGALHGYGGGLWRKEWLLRHERALPPGLFDDHAVRPPDAARGSQERG